MQRIEPIDLDHAPVKARELVDEYAARAGAPGPMVRTMATVRLSCAATSTSIAPRRC
ncbi:MAG TPA: hypothetical protein VEX67_12995 [Solirubrobacteraceae bacterium]|nr:hypothetical protein [Solirubrobacteraceae bacterium]